MSTVAELYDVLRYAHVTEKSTAAMQNNKYIFKVSMSANKNLVSRAVTMAFDVKVKSVNILKVKGKNKKFRGMVGKRSDYKKAIVTLEDNQTIDLGFGD